MLLKAAIGHILAESSSYREGRVTIVVRVGQMSRCAKMVNADQEFMTRC